MMKLCKMFCRVSVLAYCTCLDVVSQGVYWES